MKLTNLVYKAIAPKSNVILWIITIAKCTYNEIVQTTKENIRIWVMDGVWLQVLDICGSWNVVVVKAKYSYLVCNPFLDTNYHSCKHNLSMVYYGLSVMPE
jgi:hypothetical protein